jgi:hypothetical protein
MGGQRDVAMPARWPNKKSALEALEGIAASGARWLEQVEAKSQSKGPSTQQVYLSRELSWASLGDQLEELARADARHCEALGQRWLACVPKKDPNDKRWGIDLAEEMGNVAMAIADWAKSANEGKPWREDWAVETYSSMESDDEGGEREEMRTEFVGGHKVAPGAERIWSGFGALMDQYQPRHQETLTAGEAMQERVGRWGVWQNGEAEEAARVVLVALAYFEEVAIGAKAQSRQEPAVAKGPKRM